MSNIDKQAVQAVADLKAGYTLGHADVAILNELARIALASLEAEPVAYIFKHPAGRLFWSLTDESNKGQSDVMPVYSAPVPAFVPPAIEPDYEVIKGILPTANPDEYACCIAADMWNACRAAMLQGAEPVTTAYKLPDGWVAVPIEPTYQMCEAMSLPWESPRFPDRYKAMLASAPHFRGISNSSTNNFRENAETSTKCWCHTCRPVTISDMRFVVCPECGNKRCPHTNDHRNACTGSNEPGQEGSAYPAAPQQEVKP